MEVVSSSRYAGFTVMGLHLLNPLIPRSDQYMNSPLHFNTLSSRQVMRIKTIIN